MHDCNSLSTWASPFEHDSEVFPVCKNRVQVAWSAQATLKRWQSCTATVAVNIMPSEFIELYRSSPAVTELLLRLCPTRASGPSVLQMVLWLCCGTHWGSTNWHTSPFSLYRLMLDHSPLNTIGKGKVMLVYWERTTKIEGPLALVGHSRSDNPLQLVSFCKSVLTGPGLKHSSSIHVMLMFIKM